MDRLIGKHALIFGADEITSGIATRFLQEGASVTVVDTPGALAGFAQGATACAIAGDDPAAVAKAVSQALGDGPLDILVIGGGDIPDEAEWRAIDDLDPAALGETARHAMAATLAAVQAAGPALKRHGGAILFMFNPAGLYSEGGWGSAPAVHHARRGLARTLAMEWGQYQVRVNTLVPLARTGGFEAYRARNPQEVDFRLAKTAMPRAGDPVKDIGGAAVFMVSDDTRYLTGSMIFADGGNFLTAPAVDALIDRSA